MVTNLSSGNVAVCIFCHSPHAVTSCCCGLPAEEIESQRVLGKHIYRCTEYAGHSQSVHLHGEHSPAQLPISRGSGRSTCNNGCKYMVEIGHHATSVQQYSLEGERMCQSSAVIPCPGVTSMSFQVLFGVPELWKCSGQHLSDGALRQLFSERFPSLWHLLLDCLLGSHPTLIRFSDTLTADMVRAWHKVLVFGTGRVASTLSTISCCLLYM